MAKILFIYRGKLIRFLETFAKIDIILIQQLINNYNNVQILKNNNIEVCNSYKYLVFKLLKLRITITICIYKKYLKQIFFTKNYKIRF